MEKEKKKSFICNQRQLDMVRAELHRYPAQGFLHMAPVPHSPIHNLPYKHLALLCNKHGAQPYSSLVPKFHSTHTAESICFVLGVRKAFTFLLSWEAKQDYLHTTSLVPAQAWLLQSRSILSLQQVKFCSEHGHFTSNL